MTFESELRDIKINLINDMEFDLPITNEAKSKFRNELRFIKDILPNDIITGSLALSLYGLIDRTLNDVDVLIKDKDRYTNYNIQIDHYGPTQEGVGNNRLGHIIFNYTNTPKFVYKIEDFLKSENKIVNFLLKALILNPLTRLLQAFINVFSSSTSYAVDFFVNSDDSRFETFEFEGHQYKIQHIMNIIDMKMKLSSDEDESWTTSVRNSFDRNKVKHSRDLRSIFASLKYRDASEQVTRI